MDPITNRYQAYDNLCDRLKDGLTYRYDSAQYHQGQLDQYKASLDKEPTKPTIFIVSCHLVSDLALLNWVLHFAQIESPVLHIKGYRSRWPLVPALEKKGSVAIPVRINDCCVEDEFYHDRKDQICWELDEVPRILRQITDYMKIDAESDFRIVSVVISKDHQRTDLSSTGAICLHMMQPFYMRQFVKSYPEPLEVSITRHFAYDTSKNAPILGPSLVAFILLNLDRRDDLIKVTEIQEILQWFVSSSTSHSMHLSFNGDVNHVVSYSLIVLGDYISYDKEAQTVRPTKPDMLKMQADVVVPKMVRLGILSRAILMSHNSVSEHHLSALEPGIRAPKERVISIARKIVELMEKKIPIRPPCESIDDVVYGTFNMMCEYFGYIAVDDPKAMRSSRPAWQGNCDSDSDYEMDLSDHPLMKSWVRMTQRVYRLERLNMCINAIEDYFIEATNQTLHPDQITTGILTERNC